MERKYIIYFTDGRQTRISEEAFTKMKEKTSESCGTGSIYFWFADLLVNMSEVTFIRIEDEEDART